MTGAGDILSRRLLDVRAAMNGCGIWSLVIHVAQDQIPLAMEQVNATLATIPIDDPAAPIDDTAATEFDRVEILYPHLGRVAILGPRRPTLAAQLAATAARVDAGESLPEIARGAR